MTVNRSDRSLLPRPAAPVRLMRGSVAVPSTAAGGLADRNTWKSGLTTPSKSRLGNQLLLLSRGTSEVAWAFQYPDSAWGSGSVTAVMRPHRDGTT